MWLYNGKEFTDEMIGDSFGFVYLVTNLETGMMYVGKKLFTKAKPKRVVNGKTKRAPKGRVSSDWRNYYGSNEQIKADVKDLGRDAFKREILHLCPNRGTCNYWEAYEIFSRHAIISPHYYNEWVTVRVTRAHVKVGTSPLAPV